LSSSTAAAAGAAVLQPLSERTARLRKATVRVEAIYEAKQQAPR
jgi:hypothetical protein